MTDDVFDFGFTSVTLDELDAYNDLKAVAGAGQQQAGVYEEKLNDLYSAIQPLLNNLKKNPEKEYILWPERLEKIEEFEAHLYKIYSGK
jgi:hypothetical protein